MEGVAMKTIYGYDDGFSFDDLTAEEQEDWSEPEQSEEVSE